MDNILYSAIHLRFVQVVLPFSQPDDFTGLFCCLASGTPTSGRVCAKLLCVFVSHLHMADLVLTLVSVKFIRAVSGGVVCLILAFN